MLLRRMSSLLLALAMLASACASGSDPDAEVSSVAETGASSAGDGGSDAAEQSESSSSDDGSASSDDSNSGDSDSDGDSDNGSGGSGDEPSMAASSPIGAFFADDGGFESALTEYQRSVEEEIVRCMAAQGFEFARSTTEFNEVQQAQNELSIREWTAQYGFGISTSFDSIAQNQASDPNTDIVFSLSAAEREVWVQTLTGGDGFGGGDFNATPLEEQGCIGAAIIATGGQEAIEGIETFGSAYEEGEAGIFDQREMVNAVDAWARCMSESGFPGFAALDDPEDSIATKFDEVTAPLEAALDELTPEEGQALVSGESLDLADLPDLDLDALRELQADEISLALVDLDCYELEVQSTYEPLRDEFESGLLTEYATEFDALKNIGS